MAFKASLLEIIRRIDRGDNFSLARYGDGELMLIQGIDVTEGCQARVQDKRKSKGMTLLGEDLGKTLDIDSPDYYYAIPCCCNPRGEKRYRDNIKSDNFTFANIFINANYPVFKQYLEKLDREVIVIANKEGDPCKYPFKVKEFLPIEDNCVGYYKEHKDHFIKVLKRVAMENNDTIVIISAGPLANIMVYEMFKANPNNTYLDVGSALDIRTKGKATRGFHLDNPSPNDMYARRVCTFTIS